MNKKLLKSTLAVAMVAVAGFGGYKSYEGYALSNNSGMLLADNVEALTSTGESALTFTVTFCSKKKGGKFCTMKRGKRDWVWPVEVKIGTTNLSDKCSDCPQDEYGYDFED